MLYAFDMSSAAVVRPATPPDLQQLPEQLLAEREHDRKLIAELRQQNDWLREQILALRRARFGSSSERVESG